MGRKKNEKITVRVHGAITHEILDNFIEVITPILVRDYGADNLIAALTYLKEKADNNVSE